MRNANGNRHLRNSWGLITGGFVLGLLLAAVGYSFSPNYVNTATNTHVTDRGAYHRFFAAASGTSLTVARETNWLDAALTEASILLVDCSPSPRSDHLIGALLCALNARCA